MRLETPRLVIRSFEPSDAEGMLQVFGDPEVRTYVPPFPDPTLERMQAGLMLVEGTGPAVEIAYHYKRTAWSKGYGTEAAIACLDRGFGPVGLEHVAICVPENVGSWRVMEKAGMRYEGTASYYGLTGLKKYGADRATWKAPA